VAFQHGCTTFEHLAFAAMPKPVSSLPTSSQRTPDDVHGGSASGASQSSRVSRLPTYRTRWIGADLQAARLQALIREHRLVTLLGPGGCGKTRLAVEVARLSVVGAEDSARRLTSGIFDRALFVGLIGCVDAKELLQRLAPALDSVFAPTQPAPFTEVLDETQGRVLLLLDNCEQLDAAAARQIALLAEHMPQAHCLLTSRRPMGLDGEREFMMSGLELPSSGDNGDSKSDIAEVSMNSAVALFVDRVRTHRVNFEVVPGNRIEVVALMHCLDGLPLAIEMAATHARTLKPAQMLALLRAAQDDAAAPDSGLKWLARRGQRSGHDLRHASMWQVIDLSWQLLSPAAQALLQAWCALPEGGELEAALRFNSADALDELLAHSMLQTSVCVDGALQHRVGELVRCFVKARSAASDPDILQI
jgi:predicted ATPase